MSSVRSLSVAFRSMRFALELTLAAAIVAIGILLALAIPQATSRPMTPGLGPVPAAALCSPDMRASGYLTTNGSFNSTSGSPSLAGDMDSATVYAFLSDLNGTNDGGSSGEKNCGNPAYRYGGVLWLTATNTATINWGAWTANANSSVCYPVYGSRDYMHANWGTTCNWSAGGSPGINYRVLSISLSPANIKYQADAALDGTGDFEFVWDSCSTFYQSAASTGKVVKTGIPKGDLDNAVGDTTAASWKPGANCGGLLTQDGTNTTQSFVYDTSNPSMSSVTGSGTGVYQSGNTIYVRTAVAGSVVLTPLGTDAAISPAANNSGVKDYLYGAMAGTTTGWSPTTSVTSAAARTYSWTTSVADATTATVDVRINDQAGNQSSSGIVVTLRGDKTAPTTTWTPATDSYRTSTGAFNITWTESDGATGSGVGTRSAQWQVANTLVNGTCGSIQPAETPAFAPSAGTATRPAAAHASCYRLLLTLTDRVGNMASVSTSPWVRIDTTPPVVTTVTDNAPAGSYRAGDTIYFRPSAAGTVTLTSDATDPESGVVSSTFGALSATTGWTYTPGTVTGDPVQKNLTWGGTAVSSALAITATNGATLVSTPRTITLTADSSAPTATFTYPTVDAYRTSTGSFNVTWNEGDTGSGVGTRSAHWQTAPLANGTCGTPNTPEAPVTPAGGSATRSTVSTATCYRLTLTLTDRVGNQATFPATAWVKVDASAPAAPVVTDNAAAGTYRTGDTIWFQQSLGGTIVLTSDGTDAESGIASSTFGPLVDPTGWTYTAGNVPGDPAVKSLTWSASASTTTINVTTTNNANLTSAARTITLIGDGTAPTATWTSPSTDTYATTTNAFDVTWTEFEASLPGVGTRTAQWQTAVLANGTCGTPNAPETAFAPAAGTTTRAAGTVTHATCYRLLLTLADRVGNTSPVATSPWIKVDATSPAEPAVTDNAPAGSFRVGDTIYIRPSAAGSLTLTSDGADPESGIASSTFGSLSTSTGWTYAPGTVAGDPVQKSLSWDGTAASSSLAITTTNGAGVTSAGRTITLTTDDTAPNAVWTSPIADTYHTSTSAFDITWNETDPSGSGVDDRSAQWQTAALANGACGTPATPESAFTPAAGSTTRAVVVHATCYRLLLTLSDQVGNVAAVATSPWVKVDTTAPPAPVVTDNAPAGSFRIADTIWFQPSAAGTITLTSDGTDPESGIASTDFGPLSAPTGWTWTSGIQVGDPAPRNLTWSAAAGSTTLTIKVQNNAGLGSAGLTLTFTADAGSPASTWTSPTSDSYRTSTAAFDVTWSESDGGAGVASRSAQWQTATLADGSCTGVLPAETAFTPSAGTATRSSVAHASCYRLLLTLTDRVGNVAAVATSPWIKVDTTAPTTPAVTDNAPAGSYRQVDTIWFRPSAASTITLTSDSTDPESGVASSGFGALSAPTGWTYASGSVAGNPANRNATWSGTAGSATLPITATNNAGLTSAARTITFAADATAPVLGSVIPAAGTSNQISTTVNVSWSETETGSGVASRGVQRQKAAATLPSQCAGATYTNELAERDLASPVSETGLAIGNCYRWQLKVTDRVGNVSATATTGNVFVGEPPPPAPSAAPNLDAASDTGPLAAVNSTYILRPTSDVLISGGSINFQPSGPPAWPLVDEVSLNVNDYFKPEFYGIVILGFPDGAIPATDKISSVTIAGKTQNGAPSNSGYFAIRDPSNGELWRILEIGQNSPADQAVTLTTRPWDGQPWTVADIDAIQAGAMNTCGSFCGLRINQFWVSVSTSGRTPPGFDTDNVTSDTTPTFSGTVDPSAASVNLYDGTTLIGTDTTVSSGTWQITSGALGNGVHAITARAAAAGGAESAASPALSITIASTGPAVDLAPSSDLGPPVLVDRTQTLRPTSDVVLSGSPSLVPSGPTAWNLVDEAWLKTEDYARPGNGGRIIFGFPQATSVGAGDRISSVTLRGHTSNGAVAAEAYLSLRNPANGTVYNVLGIGQNSASNQVVTLTSRPWGGSWTKADVDNLQAGGTCSSDYCNLSIYQFSVDVNYRPESSTSFNTDNLTSDPTPTFTGASSPTATRVDLLRNGVVVGSDTDVADGTWSITSTASPDGVHSFTALAYDAADIVTTTLPALSVEIDTAAPDAPGTPDLLAASDTGESSTDDITNVKQPGFSGTSPADAETIALFDETVHVADDVAPTATYTVTASWPLLAGERQFTAVAFDLAGNASAASSGLTISIVDFLRTVRANVQTSTNEGAETWVVVTTRDETGQPISSYSGTVTVTTSDGGAVFPDGNTYAFGGRPDETGVNIRVLFSSTGTKTINVTGTNGIVGTSTQVSVGESDLQVTAPATVYQNVRFDLKVRPHDISNHLITAYAARVTFSSTDGTANYGSEVSANQYTFVCTCDDGHIFPTRLGTLGLQTITVTDQFGNSGQVTVNVIGAPGAIANPFEVRAVQWNHGNVVDFYIDPGAYTGSYSVVGIEHRCTATGTELLGVTGHVGTFVGKSQFSSDPIPRPDCSNINNWEARNHTLFITDDAGHQFAVAPSGAGADGSLSSAGVFFRYSSIPNNSRWTMIDPGHPVISISNTNRVGSPIMIGPSPEAGKIWKWVPGGDTIAINMAEPAVIFSVAFRTGIITDFDKGVNTQYFPLGAGQQSFHVDDIQHACWFGPRSSDGIRFSIKGGNGRRGLVDVGLLPATADGNEWCSGNMGPSPSPMEKPVYHDLFDGFREWAETDPVDPYSGGYLHDVTDFALGGLSPSLSLTRRYNSQVAEAQAAGTETRYSIFGRGWSSSLDWNLVESGVDGVMTLYANGMRLVFDRNGDGSYSPVVGTSFRLSAIAGGYKVTDDTGGGRRFDVAGRTVAIFDAQGREMNLTYTAGNLSAITDAANRTAQISTNAAGYITQVLLPDGRHVDFTYDADGFMTSQRTLDGKTLTIVSDRRGRITSLKDEGGETLLVNTYDGKGRVFRQTNALGDPSFLVYNPQPLGQVTRVISPRGGVTTDCFGIYGSSLIARVDPIGGIQRWTYDHRGNPLTAVDELGNTTRYAFDAFGRVTGVVDELGRSMSITYNAAGRISNITDSTGGAVTTTFDPTTGLPTTVTQSKGANSMVTAGYSYDPTTKLPRFITGPSGSGTAELQYDSRGYISASIDAEGRKNTFVTDARGFITEIVDPLGNVAGGNPAQHRTTLTYDDMGRVLTETNPLGETTTYSYDEFGRIATAETEMGHLTTYVHDDLGQLTSVTSELTTTVDAVTTYEYDEDGNLTAVVDAEDRRTEYVYDLAGRLVVIIDADSKHWNLEYDATGRLLSTEDPTGRSTSTAYDAAGRTIRTTDAAGQDTTYTYTPTDQVETVTDPLDHVTTFGYDWRGFQTSVTNELDEVTEATYDDSGHVLTVTDGRDKTTTYEYDLTGLLEKVIEHGGTIETTFGYDDAGRLETRTNDRAATETYQYDALGRVTRLTDPIGKFWQTFYDADGRVDYTIDAKNQTTDFTYDRGSRLLTTTPASGPAISYVYDKTSRLTSMTDGNGTTAYDYDPLGRLTSFTRGGRTTGYTYDNAGRPKTVVYPNGQGTVTYGYDTAGRLDTITDWASRVTEYTYDDASNVTGISRPGNLDTTIGYDALNRPEAVTHERNGNPVLALGFGYDAAGNLDAYTDNLGTATFGYDDLNRLTSAAYPGGQSYAYSYDAVGNILSATTPAGTRTYTYDLADRITSAGPGTTGSGNVTKAPTANNAGWTTSGNAYATDDTYATAAPAKNQTSTVQLSGFDFSSIPAGATINSVTVSVEWKVNVNTSTATLGARAFVGTTAKGTELVNSAEPTADTTQTFTVPSLTRADLNNLLVHVRATRGNDNNAFTASLDAVSVQVDWSATIPGTAPTYDDNGNMTSDGSYGNRTFTYDALGRLTGVAGNGVTASYTLDGFGNRWAETLNAATTNFDLDLSLADPTVLSGGGRKYLPGAPGGGYEEAGVWYSGLTDQHGSLLGTVSETGIVSAFRTYDPYGAARPTSPDPTGIGFTGEWKNSTGLVHLRFRDYDPAMGRFIGRDTFPGLAAAPQTGNRYAFAAGNPLTAADPSGHFNNHLIMPVRAFVSMGVQFMGPIGLAYTMLSGVLGYDIIAGVNLTPEERILAVAPMIAVGIIAKVGAKLASLAPRATSALSHADDAAALGRLANAGSHVDDASALGRVGTTAGTATHGSQVARAANPARQALLNRVREAGSLSEARGIVNATRQMNRIGSELVDVSLAYRGRQGVDLVFFNPTTARYAIVEAKAGRNLSALKNYIGGRQGSLGYNETRLDRYLRFGDHTNDAFAQHLLNELRAGNVDSFAAFNRSGKLYELPNLWPMVPPILR